RVAQAETRRRCPPRRPRAGAGGLLLDWRLRATKSQSPLCGHPCLGGGSGSLSLGGSPGCKTVGFLSKREPRGWPAVGLEPLLHHPSGARLERLSRLAGDQRLDPVAGELGHESSPGADEGEELYVELERGRAEALSTVGDARGPEHRLHHRG